ncbi:MarR family winged helix-turn-helix transcriptional regulator [Sinisalibacter aestuarii]|nr:MarR family transcriptional regulator [Sinisalibacter aestuarii]
MSANAKTLPRFHADLPDRLEAAGFAPAVVEALLGLDAEMFVWHRRAAKGELVGLLLSEMDLGLELSQFFALMAINRIEHGIARAQAEPATVGLLAEEMAIDPSRASRIASGLIAEGWLRRDVAQGDGRKSILVITDKARDAFSQFRDAKWDKLLTVFADWSAEDIQSFSRLFTRYSNGMARVHCAGDGGTKSDRMPDKGDS